MIPNTAQIVDYAFNLLDLQLKNTKRTTIDSRSEFQKQNELFHEKCSLITSALTSSESDDLWLYVDHTIGTFLDAMRELNSSIATVAMDESSEQKNRIAFISYWLMPFHRLNLKH
ncbi:hypothetical protein G6Z92_19480 [Vibrio aestuarianus subsp. cardii]|uniref:hypothetical protein n=1 Tax=Vibrio aestuarianus TaxID=28171 RepID=UPI0015C52AB8|nr:hypothetical protein [Vibrio aestuarianus]NGZ69085.1 hypothetical protein [Vibrio aestuarianus subsp. cardii]